MMVPAPDVAPASVLMVHNHKQRHHSISEHSKIENQG